MPVSQWDRLIKRILSLSNDLLFDELRRVLEDLGYAMSATQRKHPLHIPLKGKRANHHTEA